VSAEKWQAIVYIKLWKRHYHTLCYNERGGGSVSFSGVQRNNNNNNNNNNIYIRRLLRAKNSCSANVNARDFGISKRKKKSFDKANE
jgi:hypothetical protein